MEELNYISSQIKNLNIEINLSYGSGGFCTILTDKNTGKQFSSYSWNLTEAFQKTLSELKDDREFDKNEDTNPGVKLLDTRYSYHDEDKN